MKPANPLGSLAVVPKEEAEGGMLPSPNRQPPFQQGTRIHEYFGKTLRIGFHNIGGIPIQRGHAKDDFLRQGITTYDFDAFGIAKVNVDWRHVSEEDKLINRSRHCGNTAIST